MKNVLIINQSAELYGADKAILELIENFPEGYVPIVVVHHEGPLKDLLESKGVRVILSSVIKLNRKMLSPKSLLTLPFHIISAVYKLRTALKGVHIDLVHSNAISVLLGAFYSSIFRIPHLWHVHEIVEHPKAIARMYPKIVPFFSRVVVFNSNATFEHFRKINPKVAEKSVVVHNGQQRSFPISSDADRERIRTIFFKSASNDIVIGLVGRISRLKGQGLLLKAFRILLGRHDNIRLAYIGSPPPGQNHFLENLEAKIKEHGLSEKVSVTDFQNNIWPFYDAMDIVTVPSTEPESFGLVATEAMLSFKPVVGSEMGGLKEIIEHGKTGFLFEPKNANDLAEKLEAMINDPKLMKEMGRNGNERVREEFSSEKFVSAFTELYIGLT